jgi:hypothetical protein
MELYTFFLQTSSWHCSQTLGRALFLRIFYYCFLLVSPAERFIRIEDFTGQVLAYGFGRPYEKRLFFVGMKHRQADTHLIAK